MIPDERSRSTFASALSVAGVLAAALLWATPAAQVASPQPRRPLIASLAEPAEGLEVLQVSERSGRPTFASRRGRGLRVAQSASTPAASRALAFVDAYGRTFGVGSRADVAVAAAPTVDALGIEHVTLRQTHLGVPVTGGELRVHLRGDRVVAANGEIVDDLPDVVSPGLPPLSAEQTARLWVEKHRPDQALGAHYSTPRLEIFNRGVFEEGATATPSHLAWFVVATGPALREYLWVDASTDELLLNFSQLPSAKVREVYTASGTGTLPGALVRAEGDPATGDADQDNAYDFSGITYDYFNTTFGRDSFDDAGGKIVSTTQYCPPGQCPYSQAFWNGSQMLFGAGYAAADDIVAHELTHGVIEYTSDLFYYAQSGALNESYADIFGEVIDLGDGVGNDGAGVRWQIGEDQPGGAVRNMMTPTSFGDPGKMSDAEFRCSLQGWTDATQDQGGVHHNSGVPNHAFALMVDGGTYNGHTVSGIGVAKAAEVQYRALTTYLTSGSGFLDNYQAVNQACTDLVGTSGITASDCTQVAAALDAVELSDPLICAGAQQTVPVCPGGAAPLTTVFFDDFEAGGSNTNWVASSSSAQNWGVSTQFSAGSLWAAYGIDGSGASDHDLAMAASVLVPAGGRLYFDHAFEFENDNFPAGQVFDGGVIEYSENDGASWIDIGNLVEDGQAYGGTLSTLFNNPLGGRAAFVRSSYGFTSTRVDLSSLVGKNILIRFRVGTDQLFGSLGWSVDNAQIVGCDDPPPSAQLAQLVTPAPGSTLTSSTVTFDWTGGLGVNRYWLYVGNGVGTFDLVNRDMGTALSTTVTLPADGRPLYVRLLSNVSGGWQFNDYTLTAATTVITQKAQLTSPAPGATLTASTLNFEWTGGLGAGRYWLYVGNTAGAFDLVNRDMGTSLSTTVAGLPTDGRTLYVRLHSNIGGGWQFNDYTLKAATSATPLKAQLTMPAPSSTLTASTLVFEWTGGLMVGQYWLYVGNTVGTFDLVNRNMGTNLSATVVGLPTDGRTLFVRLHSLIGGAWQFTDYTLTAPTSGVPQKAQLTTPASASTLTASTVTFEWTGGIGVKRYWLYVGSSVGAFDLVNRDMVTGLSTTVSLPADGRTLYVRLHSAIGGAWQFNDYTLTAPTGVITQKAQLTSPAPGVTLTASTVTFEWTGGLGVDQYWLYVGNAQGTLDLVNRNMGKSLSTTVAGLPTDGRTLYVRLFSHFQGGWQFNDYTLTAANSGTPQKAQLTTPAPGSTLTASTLQFEWTGGLGVGQYWLYVGSTAGTFDLVNLNMGTSLSAIVAGLPTDGRTLYVRLHSAIGGVWQFNDYVLTAPTGGP